MEELITSCVKSFEGALISNTVNVHIHIHTSWPGREHGEVEDQHMLRFVGPVPSMVGSLLRVWEFLRIHRWDRIINIKQTEIA